ncbi:MAG: type II toxin-antitoxin system HicA family toxin [Lachnospiraceae bacterium]
MPITAKQMIKLLESNVFKEVRQNGFHKFFINKETGRMTTVPYHNKDLPIGTEKKIKKDAGLE